MPNVFTHIFHNSILPLWLSFYTQAIANASITGFVAVISLFVMKTKFKMIHYASMLISCAGMVMVILEDFNSDSDGGIYLPDTYICVLV